jgi:hypothetical protein
MGTHPTDVAAGIGLCRRSYSRSPASRNHYVVCRTGHSNGKVLTKCRQRHRHQEYLSFLREIEKNVPKNLEVHIIVDN